MGKYTLLSLISPSGWCVLALDFESLHFGLDVCMVVTVSCWQILITSLQKAIEMTMTCTVPNGWHVCFAVRRVLCSHGRGLNVARW